MKLKTTIVIIFMVFTAVVLTTVGFVSAEVQTLGTFKQNSCVTLPQTCGNCSYINVSTIKYPNSTIEDISATMTKNGVAFNYTFCRTGLAGDYIINGYGDPDGASKTVFAYDFVITPSGENGGQLGYYFLVIALVYGIYGLGVWKQDITITLLGTLGLYLLGLYVLFYGLDVTKNYLTEGFALVTLGIAFYMSVIMANEYIIG